MAQENWNSSQRSGGGYPGSADKFNVDMYQMPDIFEYDRPDRDTLPGIWVRDGWAYFKVPFLWLEKDCWDDLQVSISNIKLPASNEPHDRLYAFGIASGVTFPTLGFAIGEYIYFDVQSTHSMALNTVLDNHIHFCTPTDGSGSRFKFKLDVIAAPVDGVWAVPTGSPFSAEHVIAADYATLHKLIDVGTVPAVNTSVSTLYKCRLERVAASTAEYAGEVYINFADCHYKKDSLGSRTEYAK